MKGMKRVQEEMFAKCYKRNGWPRPFVHFPGIVELVHSEEQWDRLVRNEALTTALSVVVGILLTCVIVWVTHP